MIEPFFQYLRNLADRFGSGWNQFWFVPSRASTLSLIRPLIGLLALWWHSTYTADLIAFFGPDGVIGPAVVRQWSGIQAGQIAGLHVSYFNFAPTAGAVWFWHWLGFAVLLLFTIGAFTRVATLLSIAVVLSYINRGPMLTSEFEPVLAMLLVYLALGELFSLFEQREGRPVTMLLGSVCGARFSMDAFLRTHWQKSPEAPLANVNTDPASTLTSVTLATRLIQVHLTAVYFMSAVAMLGSEAWWSGGAVWWLLARPEENAFPLAKLLASHPYVVNLWTYAIVSFELAFPLLVWKALWRPLMIALALPVWAAIALASGYYLYSAIMLVATLAFVTPEVIDAIVPRRAALRSAPADVSQSRQLETARV